MGLSKERFIHVSENSQKTFKRSYFDSVKWIGDRPF